MGRYGDELRRMTRAQGGGSVEGAPPASDEAPRRPYRLLLGALAVVVLVGGGWLIVRQLQADSKLQDCVMSGRKNCVPIEIDSAGR